MDKYPPASLEDRYRLVLSREQVYSRKVAIQVIEKPKLSVWMVLIPILFLHYIYRYQRFQAGVEEFAREFVYTRKLALDAALNSIKSGIGKPDAILRASDFYNKTGLADKAAGVRQKQMKEIEVLFDHYERLLKAEGDSYESLLRHAYVTGAGYMQFLSQLQKAEREVNRAVMHAFSRKEGFSEIISRIETVVEELRMEEVEKIFS